jgi:hypothetical protein
MEISEDICSRKKPESFEMNELDRIRAYVIFAIHRPQCYLG